MRAQINFTCVTAQPFMLETTERSLKVYHAWANNISDKGRKEAKRKPCTVQTQGRTLLYICPDKTLFQFKPAGHNEVKKKKKKLLLVGHYIYI